MVQMTSLKQNRIEIYRIVELLNDFYIKVLKYQEKHLVIDVERIIRLFKSKFFQALIDIQEYYVITLLDHVNCNDSMVDGYEISSYPCDIICHQFHSLSSESSYKRIDESNGNFEVVLKRKKAGLGFSIAGGIDNPHLPNDSRIYVTKIIPDGAAAIDGRLQIKDIITKVNDQSLLNITHSSAVLILKQAGEEVILHIQRCQNEIDIIEITLFKNSDGFGFSITGGKDNQHIPSDNGIFVTKILEGGVAFLDGRLKVGDKIIGIKNADGMKTFDNITHQQAVEILKAVEDRITLLIEKRLDDIVTHDFEQHSTLKVTSTLQSKQVYTSESHLDNCGIIDTVDLALLSDQVSQTTLKDARQVHLRKGRHGFGFNIVGGEDGDSIYISFILKEGPAFIDGTLKKGDRIVSVNGIDFKNISHEKAVGILKGSNAEIDLIVEHDQENYKIFEKKIMGLKNVQSVDCVNLKNILKTNGKKCTYLRALFKYDPSKDEDLPSIALSFCFGDILYVTNASDEEWWVAIKLNVDDEVSGIIPSRRRWERKQRARDRTVKFEGDPSILTNKPHLDRRRRNYSFSRKFPFMKNKDDKYDDYPEQEPYMQCYTQSDTRHEDFSRKEILYRVELPYMEELTLVYLEKDVDEEDLQELSGEENILSYEEVEQINITFARPVVILGPLKDKINDDLISQYPEKFGSCVPHTTRPKRDDEIEGCDYHFVSSRSQMEIDIQNHLFIEAGQYNENLYGTSISSVNEVAKTGKHCILDVSGNAIKRLYAAHLYPIALFVKVMSAQSLMKILKRITDDQANKLYQRSLKIEQDFTEHFTGIIEDDDYEKVYQQILDIIARETGPKIWIPSKYRGAS
ncbi:disks large 1 tumor suppressor protein-like isoform X2 [Phymastichus coffea]|uniref:disks large 1 tumor suppressor protein-like isoform X2 n=1 Tax=Phymastichus coffea TaxID=108790 RepID=UPI00273CBB96|nr:disks large 1 tumor suppressor protein-like isoform X2 [Phymastichus coffea]